MLSLGVPPQQSLRMHRFLKGSGFRIHMFRVYDEGGSDSSHQCHVLRQPLGQSLPLVSQEAFLRLIKFHIAPENV